MCGGEALIFMNDGTRYPIALGETILIPASMEDFKLAPVNGSAKLLVSYMPQLTDGPDLYLNYDEPEDEAHGSYQDRYNAEGDDDMEEDDDCGCGHDHGHSHDHGHCGCGHDQEMATAGADMTTGMITAGAMTTGSIHTRENHSSNRDRSHDSRS